MNKSTTNKIFGRLCDALHCLQCALGQTINPNLLRLGIHPDEKINLTFQTKTPAASVRLRSVAMDFNYKENYSGPIFNEYEKILDCMQGDQIAILERGRGRTLLGIHSSYFRRMRNLRG